MADNVVVSNAPASSNTDIPVRTTETAGGKHLQHMRLDLGSGSTESVASGTLPVSASALPLPTGAATAANQLPDGHNVTVDNAAGAAAVNIQDGGNSITVDGSVTVSGTVSVTEPVSVDDNGGSLTVDGTVAVSSVGGTVAISAVSLPLPTGAATLAEQQTQTASLSVLDDWDESDRAKVNTRFSTPSVTTDTLTSISDTVSVSLTSEPSVIFEISGTYSGIVLAFEAQYAGSSNWIATAMWDVQAGSYSTQTGSLSSSTKAFIMPTTGATAARIRAASYSSGAMNVRATPCNAPSAVSLVNVSSSSTLNTSVISAGYAESSGNSAPGLGVQLGGGDNVVGDFQYVQLSQYGLHVVPHDSAGAEISPIQASDVVSYEDAVHSSGSPGILALTRRADTASSSAGTNGDYATLNTDANGRLHTVDDRTGASAQQVQGPSAVGGSITTGNLFPCGFKDLFNNGVIPTGLDASGVVVMGVLPLDLSLNIQDCSASGEVFSLGFATNNSSATARYAKVDSNGGVVSSYQSREDTFTSTGNGTTVDVSGSPHTSFALSVRQTGTVTAWTVVLEGSNDGTTFTTILTHTNATGSGTTVWQAAGQLNLCRYFRARCSALTLGVGTNVISTITGVQ